MHSPGMEQAVMAFSNYVRKGLKTATTLSSGRWDLKDFLGSVADGYMVGGVVAGVKDLIFCVCVKSGSKTTELASYYPSNNGAVSGTEKNIYLMKGDAIDRYSGLKGKYFSPTGTPMEMRALPYDADLSQYRQFVVFKPFEVEASTIAPAFGKIGLGTQYRSSIRSSFEKRYYKANWR